MNPVNSISNNPALSALAIQLGVPEETLLTVLRLFYDEYYTLPEVANQIILKQDWRALQGLIHKMKGSSGSLQMAALRNQLVELEGRLKQGQTLTVEQMQPLYSELQQVIDCYQLGTRS